MPVTSLDGLSKYTSNTLTDEVRDKADSAATDTKFLGTSNLIQNTSNDIMDDVNTKASATNTKFLGTSNLIQNTSNDIMDDVNTKADATTTDGKFVGTSNLIQDTSNYIINVVNTKADATTTDGKFVGTSNLIQDTSNYISDRITNLSLDSLANGEENKFIVNDQYDGPLTVTETLTVNGDVTLLQKLSVSGDLEINGTTTTVNTSVYTTESLEVVSSSLDQNSPALKVTETGSANIMEVYKDSTQVITVDNSGDITTTGTINGASPVELGYVSGVTSSIQTQLDNKQAKLTNAANAGTNVTITDATGKIDVTIPALDGAISEITATNLETNRALYSDGNGKIQASVITTTELNYLDGVTSGIQTQLDNKQPTIDNTVDFTARNITANVGTFTGALRFERSNPYFQIKDTTPTEGKPDTFTFHTNGGAGHIMGHGTGGKGSIQVIDLATGDTQINGNLTTDSNLTVNGTSTLLGRVVLNNKTDGGTSRGLMFWEYGNTDFGMYMAQSGAGKSFSGDNACTGHGFNAYAIRIRGATSGAQGLIYENSSEQCKFSVRASDGLGYFAGGLQVDGNITTDSNLTVNGRTTVPYSPSDGTKTGIDLYGGNSRWGIYVASGTGAISMGGNTACTGHNFDYQSIRLRTEKGGGYGLIYETVDTTTNVEQCKFSVSASDGYGFFAGGLQVDGELAVGGNITTSGTINGVTAAQFSEMASGGGGGIPLYEQELPAFDNSTGTSVMTFGPYDLSKIARVRRPDGTTTLTIEFSNFKPKPSALWTKLQGVITLNDSANTIEITPFFSPYGDHKFAIVDSSITNFRYSFGTGGKVAATNLLYNVGGFISSSYK